MLGEGCNDLLCLGGKCLKENVSLPLKCPPLNYEAEFSSHQEEKEGHPFIFLVFILWLLERRNWKERECERVIPAEMNRRGVCFGRDWQVSFLLERLKV